jgi:eukaryotic-like serine/threonine-protein kinase
MTDRSKNPSSPAPVVPSGRGASALAAHGSAPEDPSAASASGSAAIRDDSSPSAPSRSGERSTQAGPAGNDGTAATETSLHAGLGSLSADSVKAAHQNELRALPVRSRARYELLGEHARGGLGKIFRARDRDLGRELAIKEMRTPDTASAARFVREALITARLEHPAIVPVHEAGRWENGEPFYAMKLVSGRTLKAVVQQEAGLTARLALLPSVIAVADAIAYAHDQGVIHRDLKASNVIVGAFGETVVIDWGLAKDLHRPDDILAEGQSPYRVDAEQTIAGTVVGTPAFMPPEQARGEEVDARADVYALGGLLYYTLSGTAPHGGNSREDILARARNAPPRPLAEVVPGLPPDLAAIVAKAMAREPEDRYQTAQALAGDLKRFQTGQLVSAHQYSLAQRALRWVRRHRGVTALSAFFVVVAAVGVTSFVLREQRLRREAEGQRDRADQQTLALLEQQGRSELAAGRPFRASVYLTEALKRRPDSLALRGLVTQAVRPMATLQRVLTGHEHDVTSVAYSKQGDRLLTASTDKTARLWSATTGEQLLVLRSADKHIEHASFSGDGSLVVTASGGKARVHDSRSGALLRTFDAKDVSYRVWFTPDDKHLVLGGWAGFVRVIDAVTGAVVYQGQPHTDRIYAAAFDPVRGRFYLAGFDRVTSIWDLKTFRPLRRITDHANELSDVVVSHDGDFLVTIESNSDMQVRNAETGDRLHTIRLPFGTRFAAGSFSPDDRTLITRSHDGVVRTWLVSSGAQLGAVDLPQEGKAMGSAVRAAGTQLYVGAVGGKIYVWDLSRPDYEVIERDTMTRETLYPSHYTPDRTRFVLAGHEGRMELRDVRTREVVGGFRAPDAVFSTATNADGSRILASTQEDGRYQPYLWDAISGTLIGLLPGHTKSVYNVASTWDGTRFATSSYDGIVRLFDAEDGSPQGMIRVDEAVRLSAVTFSPDGSVIAAVNENGKLYLYDAATQTQKAVIDAHRTWIQDVEFSRDGERIITSGRQDHTAKVWNARTGALELTLVGHTDNLMHGSFSFDGRFIATSAMDHTARVWDSKTGELIRTLDGASYGAQLSADGSELFSVGYYGYIVLWDMSLDERSPSTLSDFVARSSPWKLIDGRLVMGKEPAAPAR